MAISNVTPNRVVFKGSAHLTKHANLILQALDGSDSAVTSGQLYDKYATMCETIQELPMTVRRIRMIVRQLKAVGCLESETRSFGRHGVTSIIRKTGAPMAPMDFNMGALKRYRSVCVDAKLLDKVTTTSGVNFNLLVNLLLAAYASNPNILSENTIKSETRLVPIPKYRTLRDAVFKRLRSSDQLEPGDEYATIED